MMSVVWFPRSMPNVYMSLFSVPKDVRLYEFKVVLRKTRPAVERRIVIAGDKDLQYLGKRAIEAMGMANCNFDLRGPDDEQIRGYDPLDPSDSDSDSDSQKAERRNSKYLEISLFFDLRKRNEIELSYGHDGWRYAITLMKIRERDRQLYPQCIGGKNACPPEDVGGPEGYKHLLKTLKNPKHNEHNDSKDWLTSMGYKNFDPKKFTASSVVFGH